LAFLALLPMLASAQDLTSFTDSDAGKRLVVIPKDGLAVGSVEDGVDGASAVDELQRSAAPINLMNDEYNVWRKRRGRMNTFAKK